jgi:hypothetical protein
MKLLAQLRRAPAKDQLDVLRWIVKKFPQRARMLLGDNVVKRKTSILVGRSTNRLTCNINQIVVM